MNSVSFTDEYHTPLNELQYDEAIGRTGQNRLTQLSRRAILHNDARLLQEFYRSADQLVQYNRFTANSEPLKMTLPLSIPGVDIPAARLIEYHLAAIEADEKYLSSPR